MTHMSSHFTSDDGLSENFYAADIQDYFVLLKPRVMSLVIFTGLCGLLMAPGNIHPILAFSTILSIAVGAGASGCLNMWWDRDIDKIMTRTEKRPIPQGRIHPDTALAFGIILSLISIITLGISSNWFAASLLTFTILFYVVIYTMWLKRQTPQNIVIGGAAGALPPMIGWCAVTGSLSLDAWILFGIIFLWTPPHFWALSLYNHEDYAKANVPMLPVVKGIKTTQDQIFLYTIFLIILSIVPLWMKTAHWLYGSTIPFLGLLFLILSWRVKLQHTKKASFQLFAYSIFYLFMVFLLMTLDRIFL